MSKNTPQVQAGVLTDIQINHQVSLDSSEWFEWLSDQKHHTFHYQHESGGFTARKERKQRGDCYWVAYRQHHNKLYKLYLGKSNTLTEGHLCKASLKLADLIDAYERHATKD